MVSRLARCLLPGFLLATVGLRAAEEPAFSGWSFENLSPDLQLAARRVMVATAVRFDRTFGTTVGRMPVSVRLVPSATVTAAGGEEIAGVAGLCVVREGRAEILVATRANTSIAAILAHEATHAFVAETFGEVRDPFLNEGLAQWFAAGAWPPLRNELRHFWLKGGSGAGASPYVAGFHWMEENAANPRLGAFLRAQGNPVSRNIDELDHRWRAFPRDPVPRSP